MNDYLPTTLPTFDEDPEGYDTRMYASTGSEPSTYTPAANLLAVLDGTDGDGESWWWGGIPSWWTAHGRTLRDDPSWREVDWNATQVNVAQVFHELGSVLVARGEATTDPVLAENFRQVGSATQRLAGLDLDGTAVVGTYYFDIYTKRFEGGALAVAHSGGDLILATTVDAVQCATTGRVESVPCAWGDVGALEGTPLSFDGYAALDPTRPEGTEGLAAYASAHAGRQFVGWTPPPPSVDWDELRDADPAVIPPRPLFLLARQTGHAARVPGSYRVWSLVYQTFSGEYDPDDDEFVPAHRFAVSDELLADAASLVAPSVADCARPEAFCAATGLDGLDRIALENELTDDGNSFENSWQRYLQLARAAADQADALLRCGPNGRGCCRLADSGSLTRWAGG